MEPVRIDAGAVVHGGRIGPNVTVEADARLVDCTVENSVIGHGAELRSCALRDSIVGAESTLDGVSGVLSVGDYTTMTAE